MSKKILITGAAGFIGYHVALKLLEKGEDVVGIDNMNAYYDVKLKKARVNNLNAKSNFKFYQIAIEEHSQVNDLFQQEGFDRVIHLAAQVGVRSPPGEFYHYVNSNLLAFSNILDSCRINAIEHLLYASSSSVYGDMAVTPFKEQDIVDKPQSLYAATKRANELMAYSYSYQYQIPTTGLRFFTVYGPWGRPDMAVYNFTEKIDSGQSIDVFGEGEVMRDFTYIDDVVEAIVRIIKKPPKYQIIKPGNKQTKAPAQILNVGNGKPISVNTLVGLIEDSLGKKAVISHKPRPAEDMQITHANIQELERVIGPLQTTSISEGINKFVYWYKEYQHINWSSRE